MALLLGSVKFQAFDSSGNPLSGGLVYTYSPGTTTNKNTYPTIADALASTNANANPVVLDSRGEANIVLSGKTKIILKDSASNIIYTEDNISDGTVGYLTDLGGNVYSLPSAYPAITGQLLSCTTAGVSSWTGTPTLTSLTFSPTTGGVVGTTTNDSAGAGKVGEVITSAVATQAITSNTLTNVTSISLTAGHWIVWGGILTNPAGSTTQSVTQCGINSTSATLPTDIYSTGGVFAAGDPAGIPAPGVTIKLSGTTTVYLVAKVTYAVSTLTINGTLSARRVR